MNAIVRPLPGSPPTALRPAAGIALDRALWRAPQAEWGLAHQGAVVLLSRDQSQGWLVRAAGRTLVALGRPLGRPDLAGLRAAAGRGRVLLYKCDARTAATARRAGWAVLPIGHEATLDLDRWTASLPACRQLRRKLRASVAARVAVALEAVPSVAELADVAADWAARHGGERGFSMGRFDRALLERQKVVVARSEGRVVAFASLFASRGEWSLDLMRSLGDAPDGAMHAVLAHAAALARQAGARRLSLAAIPDPAAAARRLVGRSAPPEGGLGQFKRSFGPRLHPLYAAAPGRASLAAGLVVVAWAVHRPDPDFPPRRAHQNPFDPPVPTCDARGRLPRPVPVPFRDAAGLAPFEDWGT